VAIRNQEFRRKLEERARKQREVIEMKKMKKEQILNTVASMRELEESKKAERFMYAQYLEMEREARIEEEKRREAQNRQLKGQEKNDRISMRIDEAYRKMEEW
jgi:hypothetical protein